MSGLKLWGRWLVPFLGVSSVLLTFWSTWGESVSLLLTSVFLMLMTAVVTWLVDDKIDR
jgi:Na+-translocating ferredoxin:NAD+ oxidoreductase RnfA subunit